MSQNTRRSICLLLLCCWFVVSCSEEGADNPATNLTDTASDTSTAEDSGSNASDNGSSSGSDNGSSGGDSSATCGNGQIEADEECDNGENNSDELSDACRTNCRNATCGDGVVDDEALSETCDDGNSVDDDGCSNLCRLPSCGDGVLQTDEACDDGSQNSDTLPNACRTDCTPARCGDGVTDANEECDDANSFNDDSCLSCINARCGDGFIRQNVETCDDQNGSSLDGCSNLCRTELGFDCQGEPSVCATVCGDGIIGGFETCDDQNTTEGDYCSADCSASTGRCGDNIIQINETCDDGNTQNGDACAGNCQNVVGGCGDGIIQANETCDDGNNVGNDYCAADCQSITGFCGDGTPQTNEQCDDGNTTFGDYCSNGCIITGACGDGVIQLPAGEVCDDADALGGDGCNATCTTLEPGWTCIIGPPTNCTAILCAANQYVQSNACVSCAPGSINPAGDNASGPNTTCETIFCNSNQHVQSNACVDCAPGTINPPGDDATGPDTACQTVFCAANQYVQNNTCVDCVPGSTRPAGDDARGLDTTCDPTLCAVNQYVQNNACVDCTPGSVNEAGDDATGSDTACNVDICYSVLNVYCTDFEQAYIKASNTGVSDFFGHTVALSGDTLAVGAINENSNATGINGNQADNSALQSGAVYVFVRSGTTWTQQAYIKASNTEGADFFGHALALSGDTLAVGAYGEDSNATGINGNQADNSASNSGAVYVFVRSGTIWTQQAYVKASNTESGDDFGSSVALNGDTLAVGAKLEDSNATGVNGNQADNSADRSGAVYVFTRSGTTWTQQAYVKASNSDTLDQFGYSVALSVDTLAISAAVEFSNATGVNGNQADNSATASGAVYVFVRSGTTWTQQAYIKASNTESNDFFGQAIALDGDTLAVGTSSEDSNATGINGNQASNSAGSSGAVYVFTRIGSAWSQQAYIKASNTGSNDYFGFSVALSGDTLAVGAYREDSSATGIDGNQTDNSASNSGAVYVFTRSGTTWTQLAYIKASNTDAADNFGYSTAIDGGTLAVGATHEGSNATGINGDQSNNSTGDSGAVYVRKIKP